MGTSSNFGNMFSMAGASIFLPFLPMLPTQILLNNFLYDLSQVTIPTDRVDESYIIKPRRWDIRLIRDFMLFMGPVSSIFDFLTEMRFSPCILIGCITILEQRIRIRTHERIPGTPCTYRQNSTDR